MTDKPKRTIEKSLGMYGVWEYKPSAIDGEELIAWTKRKKDAMKFL